MTEKIKILVVDDNAVTTEMLRRLLCKDNIVETAETGRDCLTKTPIFSPDIILLDLMLPDIDGYQICRTLRSSLERHQPTIIIVSARSSRKDKLHAYQAGADDYIVKPFFNEELTAKILAYSKLKRIENDNEKNKDLLLTLTAQTRALVQSLDTFISSTPNTDALPLAEQQCLNIIARSRDELIPLLEAPADETKNINC